MAIIIICLDFIKEIDGFKKYNKADETCCY